MPVLATSDSLRYNAFMIARLLLFFFLLTSTVAFAQRRPPAVRPEPSEIEKPADSGPALNSPSKLLKYQHEEVKKDMERLSKLVDEVQQELDKAGANVLPLNTLKKLEEVEKLAHKIRGRIRQ